MAYAADDYPTIAANRAKIRKEQGLPDDNWQTATGADLDACAAGYDLYRKPTEGDYDLRKRVEAVVDKLRSDRKLVFWAEPIWATLSQLWVGTEMAPR